MHEITLQWQTTPDTFQGLAGSLPKNEETEYHPRVT